MGIGPAERRHGAFEGLEAVGGFYRVRARRSDRLQENQASFQKLCGGLSQVRGRGTLARGGGGGSSFGLRPRRIPVWLSGLLL